MFEKPQGMFHIEDSSIIGNSDKMLFFTKELTACSNDHKMAMNPYVIGKLDINQVKQVDFSPYMGYVGTGDPIKPEDEAKLPSVIEQQPI